LGVERRLSAGSVAKRARSTPSSAAGGSRREASPSPSAARDDDVAWGFAFAALPRRREAADRPSTPSPAPEPADGTPAAEPTAETEFPFLDSITPPGWEHHEVLNIIFEKDDLAHFSGVGPSDYKAEPDMGYSLAGESAFDDIADVLGKSWIPATRPAGKKEVQKIAVLIRKLLRVNQRAIAAGASPREGRPGLTPAQAKEFPEVSVTRFSGNNKLHQPLPESKRRRR
jgi:hypothetical protein